MTTSGSDYRLQEAYRQKVLLVRALSLKGAHGVNAAATAIALQLKPYETSAQPSGKSCCTITDVRRCFWRSMKNLLAFQRFEQVVLTVSLGLHEEDS